MQTQSDHVEQALNMQLKNKELMSNMQISHLNEQLRTMQELHESEVSNLRSTAAQMQARIDDLSNIIKEQKS